MKSATTFFKPSRYNNCTLNSEINAKWRCFLGEIGVETREIAVTNGFMIGPQLEKTSFAKMSEVFDCCLSGKKFAVKG